eukprot:jgi/Hompol1/1970/HPOL_005805-RA
MEHFAARHSIKIPIRQVLQFKATADRIREFDKQMLALADSLALGPSATTPEVHGITRALQRDQDEMLIILLKQLSSRPEIRTQMIETLADIDHFLNDDTTGIPPQAKEPMRTLLAASQKDIIRKTGRSLVPHKPWFIDSDTVNIRSNDSLRKHGDLGPIYTAQWHGQDVAVEMITLGTDMAMLEAIDRDAERWIALDHPNILHLFGVVLNADEPFVVLALMESDLVKYLESNPDLSLETRLHLLSGLAKGMQFLHNQHFPIFHGTLRSSNILVGPSGDIAIAGCLMKHTNTLSISRPTATSRIPDTAVAWIAPELLKGTITDPTAQTDVFAFGITASHILSGKMPFSGIEPSMIPMRIAGGRRPDLPPTIPESLWSLVEQCWNQDPAKRPSFDTIVSQLDAIISESTGSSEDHQVASATTRQSLDSHEFAIPDVDHLIASFPYWTHHQNITKWNWKEKSMDTKSGRPWITWNPSNDRITE